jgi:hypothetical protein
VLLQGAVRSMAGRVDVRALPAALPRPAAQTESTNYPIINLHNLTYTTLDANAAEVELSRGAWLIQRSYAANLHAENRRILNVRLSPS